jgi:hypothetical protein
MPNQYLCPVCDRPGEHSPRYPKYVCVECARTATDSEGRPLKFSNESFSGGYVAWYRDTGEPYDSHVCYVAGRRCWADEAHMGGIVVSLAEDGLES